ncbi:MAG: PAS domain-containing protein [Bacillus subtilis]|nr:PAS domain-containing protein [Bacillus subtilis]
MHFKELIHPADLEGYVREIEGLTTGKVRQTVHEYRIANRKKQYYWVKESLYAINIGGIEYLESTTSNITSTRDAIDQLRAMDAAPKNGEASPTSIFRRSSSTPIFTVLFGHSPSRAASARSSSTIPARSCPRIRTFPAPGTSSRTASRGSIPST